MTTGIDLLFGNMKKLGPSSDADTRHALGLLPSRKFESIVDAGCGSGRQTIVLARDLNTLIHAIDAHQPFLDDLHRYAGDEGIGHLIQTHCMDTRKLPDAFRNVDRLWSEGAAYNIGFANAPRVWSSAVAPRGCVALTELTWLSEDAPGIAKEFFAVGYPAMQSVQQNIADCQNAGYQLLTTYTLPKEAWTDDFYEVLEPRATSLADHTDGSIRELAAGMLQEIEVFKQAGDSYGYVFYILQRN